MLGWFEQLLESSASHAKMIEPPSISTRFRIGVEGTSTSRLRPLGTAKLSPSTGAKEAPHVEAADQRLTYLKMSPLRATS